MLLTYNLVRLRFEDLPDYVRDLKSEGVRFVTILDPFISTGAGPDYRPYQLGRTWVLPSPFHHLTP